MPKVLNCQIGKFPLANLTSVAERQGHNSQNDGHDIPSTSFQRRDPNAEGNFVVMTSINRSQSYPAVIAHCKSRKDFENWTLVRLGNPRPKVAWKLQSRDIGKDKMVILIIRH